MIKAWYPAKVSAQDIESARAVIVVIAVVAAVFWKAILRVLLALIVVAVGVGAFVLRTELPLTPAARTSPGRGWEDNGVRRLRAATAATVRARGA